MSDLQPFSITLLGRHLVEASAGTGKTYNITSLFIRCLIEKEVNVEEILVLTYTRAATEELKERILGRLRASIATLREGSAPESDKFMNQLLQHVARPGRALDNLREAHHNFDEASIFTIHSFCQRALQEQSFLSGIPYDSELVTDDSDLVQEAVDDRWRKMVERAGESDSSRLWLKILREEGYLPEKLHRIVSAGIGKPYLQLSITPPAGESREAELERLVHLFDRLREIWPREKATVKTLLLSDAMDGRRYRTDYVEKWAGQMDDWLKQEEPSSHYFEQLERFSIDFIRTQGVKEGADAPDHPLFHRVREYMEQTGRVRSWLPSFKKELLEEVRQTVRERKLAAGILGYDDLLVLLHEALNRDQTGNTLAGFLSRSYPVALVDEFQDTDPIQYEILKSIYRNADGTALFLIGDPKQSIYSFRGADLFSYMEARSDVPAENTYGLDRNFRSEADLIAAVNAVFGKPDTPFMFDEIRFSPARAAAKQIKPLLTEGSRQPLFRFLESAHLDVGMEPTKSEARERAAELTAEAISRLLNSGENGSVRIGERPVGAKDIAVLVRTHRQAELIRDKLQMRSVKSVQYSERSVFDTDEARSMELLLNAVAEPRNERALRTALATDLFNYDARDLLRLEDDGEQWTGMVALFSKWHRLWQERGFTPMLRTFLRDAEIRRHLVSLDRGERKLTNTLQLGELLQAREKERRGGMFEMIKWLAHKRSEPDMKAEEEQLRLESDEELVRIVTMHRSKGLEYPLVYCPFLWDGSHFSDSGEPFLYHDTENENRASLDLDEKGSARRDRHRLRAAIEELSENLRLAYVAMTRAIHQCTIVFETPSGMELSPLGYLLLGKEKILELLEAKLSDGTETDPVAPSAYSRELDTLVARHGNLMKRHSLDDQARTGCTAGLAGRQPDKTNRTLTGRKEIRSQSVVSSFSSIVHPSSAADDEEWMSDEFYLPAELTAAEESGGRSIFSFPKGPQAGTCVHTIFEELPFTASEEEMEEVIGRNLEQFGFDGRWSDILKQNVTGALHTELKPGIRLGEIDPARLLKEMEFYFDLEAFHREELFRRIREGDERELTEGGRHAVSRGFMKGYIDLVFRHDDSFYILDYKTNYLGDSPADYESSRLQEEMTVAGYDLQYHIYTVALHRFLATRLHDYSYKKHFGGVFYLFLRGMGPGDGKSGIYFDRPPEEKIEQLDSLFSKGGA